MALRSEVVNLVRLHLLHNVNQARRVGQVAIVQDEISMVDMRVFIQVIDAIGIEQRSAALDAVNFISLAQ